MVEEPSGTLASLLSTKCSHQRALLPVLPHSHTLLGAAGALTFWPCMQSCVSGRAVSALWKPCATARPPHSTPSPLSSVLASMTASRASLTLWAAQSALACGPYICVHSRQHPPGMWGSCFACGVNDSHSLLHPLPACENPSVAQHPAAATPPFLSLTSS